MISNKKFITSLIILLMFFALSKSVFAESEIVEYKENISENVDKIEDVSFSGEDLNYFEFTSKKTESVVITNLRSFLAKVGATYPKSYQTTGLTVKNQKNTTECWAFSFTSAIEAYNKVHNINNNIYSPRHVDYSSSKSFIETVSDNYFNREVTEYGNMFLTTAYASSLKGPVLESDMPFTNDTSKISLDEINKITRQQVTGIEYYNNVYKKLNSEGNVECYYDSTYSQKMSDTAINSFRNKVKDQIYNNGGIIALVYNEQYADICVTDSSKNVNHAVLIVGWDDEYQSADWKNPGAYIALNSYGTGNFKNGYCYISYDDFLVENALVAVTGVKDNDSYNVYEHDELGATGMVSYQSFDDSTAREEISAVNIFNRDASKMEILKEVGITNFNYEKVEIYFTEQFITSSKGNELPYNFVKISKSEDEEKVLDIGYHVFELESPIQLTGSKFAICVKFKQANASKIATVAVEDVIKDSNGYDNEWYRNITGEAGETYFIDNFNATGSNIFRSLMGIRYNDSKTYYKNASIKAFTTGDITNPSPSNVITSNKYSINNNIIKRVSPNTDITTFKSNITVNGEYVIVDKNGNTVSSGIIMTGYKVKTNEHTYSISVIGDLSGDGIVDILDLNKMRAHIVGRKGFVLTNEYYYAADTSNNGEVDIQDLVQIRYYIVGKMSF